MNTIKLLSALPIALILTACGGNTKTSDSGSATNGIVDSAEILRADSLAAAEAARSDSVARADSIARVDSIAKAAAEKAKAKEANRDKSIDQALNRLAGINEDLKSDEPGTWAWHEAQVGQEIVNDLNRKTDRMSPKQLARFKKLKKVY